VSIGFKVFEHFYFAHNREVIRTELKIMGSTVNALQSNVKTAKQWVAANTLRQAELQKAIKDMDLRELFAEADRIAARANNWQ
jgi:hypothetical protein